MPLLNQSKWQGTETVYNNPTIANQARAAVAAGQLRVSPSEMARWFGAANAGAIVSPASGQSGVPATAAPDSPYTLPAALSTAIEPVASYEQQIQRAMVEAAQTTQDRAAADRTAALAGYDSATTLLNQLSQTPESIDPATAAAIYAKARTGIQAGTQNIQRGLERSFAQRGMTGSGLALDAAAQAAATGVGQQAGVQRDIGIQQALQRRTDYLNLAGAQEQLAGAKAGILSNTITAVPDLYKDPQAYLDYVKGLYAVNYQPAVSAATSGAGGGGGYGGTVTVGTSGPFLPPMAPAASGRPAPVPGPTVGLPVDGGVTFGTPRPVAARPGTAAPADWIQKYGTPTYSTFTGGNQQVWRPGQAAVNYALPVPIQTPESRVRYGSQTKSSMKSRAY